MATEGRSFEVDVKGARPDLVWRYLDFGRFGEVAPDVESCTVTNGVSGEPGCTRCVVLKPRPGQDGQSLVLSVTETLVSIDYQDLSFVYEILENSLGFVGYTGYVKVVPNGEGEGDSKILWSFQGESYGQWTADLILVLLKTIVQNMATTIERVVEKGSP